MIGAMEKTARLFLAIIALLGGFAIFGWLAWRSAPAASAGSVLVLEASAHEGPVRVVTAPWSARRLLSRQFEVPTEFSIDLGHGSSWPVRLRTWLRVDAARLDAAGRSLALSGELESHVAARASAAFHDVLTRVPRDELLGRPASLGDPVRAVLSGAVPPGFAVEDVRIEFRSPPEQARNAALAVARTAAGAPVARVIYVGLDAADWQLIDPLIAAGKLPNFARLMREGVRADLRSYEPMVSPMLWTTALTGRSPDVHGITDFVADKPDGTKVPVPSTFRQVPALWEMLAVFGQSSGFANFWCTEPAEEVPGILVTDLLDKIVAAHDRGRAIPRNTAWPPSFVEAFLEELYTTETVPASAVRAYAPSLSDAEIADGRRFWRDPQMRAEWKAQAGEQGRRSPVAAFLVHLAANSHNVETIGRRMIARDDLGVVGVYFYDIDEVGHNFMHLVPPPHPLSDPAERQRFGGVMEAVYREQDAALGRLRAAAGPAAVFVVHSDHGFQHGADRPRGVLPFAQGQPVEWHRHKGIFLAAGGPVRRNVTVPDVTLYDIAPTILALRGLPADDGMCGKIRADLFDPETAARLSGKRIGSYVAIAPARRYGDGDDAESAEAKERALEALRGLGYVAEDVTPKKARANDTAEASAETLLPSLAGRRYLATWLLNNDRFADAARVLEEANAIEPMPKSYWLLSEARAGQGDLEGAVAALEEGFEKSTDSMDPAAVRWLVELRLRQGKPDLARDAVARHRAILARDPGEVATVDARLAESSSDPASARAAYLAALERDPRQVGIAERYAALSPTVQERARLEPILRRALEQDPRIEQYWKYLGLIYVENGDPLRAAQAFERAAELIDYDEALLQSLATAWNRAGRPADARRAYEKLAAHGTKVAGVYVNLGSLSAQAGDWRAALRAWEKAVELGADSPELRAGIAEARRRGAGPR